MGTFTHINNVITLPSIAGADLTVTLVGEVVGGGGSTPFNISGTYRFDHNETPNSGTCPPNSVTVCDDIVTLIGTTEISDSITIDGDEYFFQLTGFAGGVNFLTQEGKSNSSILRGEFTTTPSTIPLPAGGWLILAGLGTLGAMRVRKSR